MLFNIYIFFFVTFFLHIFSHTHIPQDTVQPRFLPRIGNKKKIKIEKLYSFVAEGALSALSGRSVCVSACVHVCLMEERETRRRNGVTGGRRGEG